MLPIATPAHKSPEALVEQIQALEARQKFMNWGGRALLLSLGGRGATVHAAAAYALKDLKGFITQDVRDLANRTWSEVNVISDVRWRTPFLDRLEKDTRVALEESPTAAQEAFAALNAMIAQIDAVRDEERGAVDDTNVEVFVRNNKGVFSRTLKEVAKYQPTDSSVAKTVAGLYARLSCVAGVCQGFHPLGKCIRIVEETLIALSPQDVDTLEILAEILHSCKDHAVQQSVIRVCLAIVPQDEKIAARLADFAAVPGQDTSTQEKAVMALSLIFRRVFVDVS